MNKIPTQEENPNGLYQRYNVTHNDGTPTDPEGFYLVLRLDKRGKDKNWTSACRMAALELCKHLDNKALANELLNRVTELTFEEMDK